MSVHDRTRRTPVLLAAAAVFTSLSLTPSVAAADPPALNRDPCATTLARAAAWPGDGPDGIRLVSDAYVSFLARQPECAEARR
jgi:hypothetical protein